MVSEGIPDLLAAGASFAAALRESAPFDAQMVKSGCAVENETIEQTYDNNGNQRLASGRKP